MTRHHPVHVGKCLDGGIDEDKEVAHLRIAKASRSLAVEVERHVLGICYGLLERLAHLPRSHIDDEAGGILGTSVIELEGLSDKPQALSYRRLFHALAEERTAVHFPDLLLHLLLEGIDGKHVHEAGLTAFVHELLEVALRLVALVKRAVLPLAHEARHHARGLLRCRDPLGTLTHPRSKHPGDVLDKLLVVRLALVDGDAGSGHIQVSAKVRHHKGRVLRCEEHGHVTVDLCDLLSKPCVADTAHGLCCRAVECLRCLGVAVDV